jgi:hypothetical protein
MLTQPEIDIVREYIKALPSSGAPPTIGLGMSVTSQALIPLPSEFVDKVPKLSGGRFKTDRNGAIAIVLGRSNRVIIPPR